jgi:diadenylate cyclase
VNSFLERLTTIQITWRDAVDILAVAFIIYTLLALIRGTRAMQMTIGLMLLGCTYFVAREFDLSTLEVLTREVFFYLPFAVIVLYQGEIRRALARFGGNPLADFLSHRKPNSVFTPILDATFRLASERNGALIVVERTQNLRMYAESGKPVDAVITPELLLNIFTPGAPLHDGAVVIQGGRIAAAGAFLPLPTQDDRTLAHGTRHRAAVSLSEESDALVIVISEENGSVAAASEGKLYENLTRSDLARMLERRIGSVRRLAA